MNQELKSKTNTDRPGVVAAVAGAQYFRAVEHFDITAGRRGLVMEATSDNHLSSAKCRHVVAFNAPPVLA